MTGWHVFVIPALWVAKGRSLARDSTGRIAWLNQRVLLVARVYVQLFRFSKGEVAKAYQVKHCSVSNSPSREIKFPYHIKFSFPIWICNVGILSDSYYFTFEIKMVFSQVWWCTALIPALAKQRLVDFYETENTLHREFQGTWACTVRPFLKN